MPGRPRAKAAADPRTLSAPYTLAPDLGAESTRPPVPPAWSARERECDIRAACMRYRDKK